MEQKTVQKSPLVALMDEYYQILGTRPIEDVPHHLVRQAGLAPTNAMAIEALARLLAVEHARRHHAEARLVEMQLREQEMRMEETDKEDCQ